MVCSLQSALIIFSYLPSACKVGIITLIYRDKERPRDSDQSSASRWQRPGLKQEPSPDSQSFLCLNTTSGKPGDNRWNTARIFFGSSHWCPTGVPSWCLSAYALHFPECMTSNHTAKQKVGATPLLPHLGQHQILWILPTSRYTPSPFPPLLPLFSPSFLFQLLQKLLNWT